MSAEYYCLIRDPQGNQVAETDNFLELSISKHIWQPGLAALKLDGNTRLKPFLVDNAQIEIYRRNQTLGIDWYPEFYGLFRKQRRTQPKAEKYYYATFPGQMTMLSWLHVAWPDHIDSRSVFASLPAETIMKLLVKYNAMPAYAVNVPASPDSSRATSLPTGTLFDGVSVEADGGRGSVRDAKCAWKNLLTAIQEIAPVAGGDFDWVKTGPASWQFRFYPGQLGVDRSATVVFSPDLGNMANPDYTLDKTSEATLAIVGGRGDANNRLYKIVTGVNYSTSNYIETFVHATENDTDSYLQAKGLEYLYKAQGRNKITFDVIQTAKTAYGKDYFLGDLVRANYEDLSGIVKFDGVNISYGSDGREEISVEVRDPTVPS